QPVSVRPPIQVGDALEFASYLARRHALTGDLLSKFGPADKPGREKRLRDLWELPELSANDFADEVSRFYKLPRVSLPQLVAASSLSVRFSRRFLRETTVFPCQIEPEGPSS